MIEYSVVVPLYNEEKVVDELYQRLKTVLDAMNKTYEIVFVDDGSKDKTYNLIEALQAKDLCLKVVKLRSNFGQTGGIAAGIDHASGRIIIPMDGDLQHAPEDIPSFIEKINEGYDIVSGWRKKRVDGLFLRRIPSKIANRLMKYLSGIELNDFGTTFKAYRRDVIENVRLYGQFHRFIPVLCYMAMKIKIAEIPIKNIVRPEGKSNYGIGRTFTVFFDLIRLKFLISFFQYPLKLFGMLGIVHIGIGSLVFLYILLERILNGSTLHVLGSSIFLLGIFLFLMGIQFIFFGLLAELMIKLYYDAHKVRCYKVEKVLGELPSPIHGS